MNKLNELKKSIAFASVLSSEPCPCGKTSAVGRRTVPLTYAQCCGPWHAGHPAPDAHALMRSRYSAFVLGLTDYLSTTWHSSTRPSDLQLDPRVKWLGLHILRHQLMDATHAEVHFVARSRWQGKGDRLEERSRFVLEAGRWWYVDGDVNGSEVQKQ